MSNDLHDMHHPLDRDQLEELREEYYAQKRAWKKHHRGSGWLLYLLIALLLIAIGFAGFKLRQKQIAEAQAVNQEVQAIPVTTAAAGRSNMLLTYKGNGDVVAASTVDVYADTASGKVTRIVAELGDRVSKGDIIMWIDPSRPGQTYAESPVRAPIAGTIVSMDSAVGALISAQMPIARVGDLSRLEVETYIPEKFVSSVSIGQRTLVSLISWKEGDYVEGRISGISPVVDPNSRTLKTVIRLDASAVRQRGIKAGMFVKISMVIDSFENVLTLPSQAIIERFDNQFVYVLHENDAPIDGSTASVEGDSNPADASGTGSADATGAGNQGPTYRVERREISSGLRIDGIARIDSGLNDGELVALKGNNLLEDGSIVRMVTEDK